MHITPHLGTGVGTVTLEYLKNEVIRNNHTHRVLALDSINAQAKKILNNLNIQHQDCLFKSLSMIQDAISAADIVLIHWWNHPLLSTFLMSETLPECRLILWCHISGIEAPNNLTLNTLKYPDQFIFTTPMSFRSKYIERLSSLEKQKLENIWSTGGVERLSFLKPSSHDGIIIGYIGNLDFTKLNPGFISLCEMVEDKTVKFVVIGGPVNTQLINQARNSSIANRIEFTGYISEEEKWKHLSTFDIFGYPLAPHHFGSCDQSIQEAMAAKVPVVVLDNPMESYMVKNNQTGLVCKTYAEYANALNLLIKNKGLRDTLGANAKEFAYSEYSISRAAERWDQAFNKLLSTPKTKKKWPKFFKGTKPTVAEVFVESLGDDGAPFQNLLPKNNASKYDIRRSVDELRELSFRPNWTSPTKSTSFHYLNFFPNDHVLKEFCNLITPRYE